MGPIVDGSSGMGGLGLQQVPLAAVAFVGITV